MKECIFMEEKKKKKMIALVIAGVALIGGVSVGTVIWANGSNKENKTTETRKVDLLETVEGLEDKLYVEVNTQGTNFLKGITYDKATIEKVLVDTSKVNYDKEGTYEIVYTFFPVDSKMDSVEKKVQIEVVSHERAEELKKEGHNVITQETEKEDSEKEDEESKGEEQKPVENPDNDNTGNAASGNNGGTGSNSNSGNTGSTSNTGSNISKPSTGGNSNQGSQKPSTPSHTHNWVQQYKTVHHAEKGHNEQYVVKEAWTESVPIYETVTRDICSACGADITDLDVGAHMYNHMINGENGGYYSDVRQVQTGTNTINHPAEYGTRYVVDQAAYDEQVPAGYKCSCGATK